MTKAYRSAMVLLLLVLVVLGINTSYKANSSLTMEGGKPFIGLSVEKDNINVTAMGEKYSVSRQEISQESNQFLTSVKEFFKAVIAYLKKIWNIFRVIFLT